MTGNEYQRLALRTEPPMRDAEKLLHACLGMAGEAGECIDLMKKHMFQGHPLDEPHMAREIGDVLWYVAAAAAALGYGLEAIMQMNIDKLKARYPEGFDAKRSLHREAGDV